MSSPSDSAQVKFIREWGEAFAKRDTDLITKFLHKDYRYTPYPRSLGLPERTRDEWIALFTGYMSQWTDSEVTIHSMIDAPGVVIIHMTHNIKLKNGVKTSRESIFIEHIVTDEDGSLKIKHAEDFTDSKILLDFLQAATAAASK